MFPICWQEWLEVELGEDSHKALRLPSSLPIPIHKYFSPGLLPGLVLIPSQRKHESPAKSLCEPAGKAAAHTASSTLSDPNTSFIIKKKKKKGGERAAKMTNAEPHSPPMMLQSSLGGPGKPLAQCWSISGARRCHREVPMW